MAGGSGDKHNLLSCVVLKTIETIETILKKQYFFILALSFQNRALALSFQKKRYLSQNQRLFYDSSSMRSMGLTASRAMSAGTSTAGHS